jgi:hypothetical protein
MITLQFTVEEMRKFLTKNGKYEIQIVSVPHQWKEYHNRVMEGVRSIEIVYPTDVPLKNFIGNKDYTQMLKWSIPQVFERELKEKLLDL